MSRTLQVLSALAVLACGAGCRGDTVVQGRVELPKPLHAPVMNKRYGIVSHAGVLTPFPPVAVVYLEGAFGRPAVQPEAQVAQKDMEFVPVLLAVQVGTRIAFPNLDDTYHNIFSYSPAKRFDLGRYRSDERPIPSEVFDTAGLVTLRCDIHEHMRALILVLDTPYFVLTDSMGNYVLRGLPEGRFTLHAWLDSKTTLSRPVLLRAGETSVVNWP